MLVRTVAGRIVVLCAALAATASPVVGQTTLTFEAGACSAGQWAEFPSWTESGFNIISSFSSPFAFAIPCSDNVPAYPGSAALLNDFSVTTFLAAVGATPFSIQSIDLGFYGAYAAGGGGPCKLVQGV